MIGTMKKTIVTLLAALGLALALAGTAFADPTASATVDLQEVDSMGNKGVEVTIKDYDRLNDMLSLSLKMDVSSPSGDINYIEPTFEFSPFIDASVKTYTTTSMDGKVQVIAYIAGAEEELFPDSLKESGVNIGTLMLALKPTVPADATVRALVEVPADGTAFSTVSTDYSTMAMPDANMRVPETPTVELTLSDDGQNGSNGNGNNGNGTSGTNGGTSSDGGDDDDDDGLGDGINGGGSGVNINNNVNSGSANSDNSDVIGKTSDTKPGQVAQTGDNLSPVVTGIVIVLVVAVVLIAVLFVVRRRNQQKQ